MNLIEFYEARRPRSYETNWHIRWMCDVVERAIRERKNAIIELPPRHGKSEVVNVYAPAWRLDSHHDAKFGLICNSDSLSRKFSVACRTLINQPLAADRDTQWKLQSAAESLDFSYFASSIRGQLTGFGFDTVIFDDLLKSGLEAKSETVRESTWENVCSAALNRLTPDGIVIALQARLHQQDTIGKLLELPDLRFLRLHLPAVNDDGGEAFFHDGYSGERVDFPPYKALWPSRYSRKKLDEIRSSVSEYYWNAQYMAAPSMGGETYFNLDRCPRYENTAVDFWWMACDPAFTSTTTGSRTAFVALGFDQASGLVKILNAWAGRLKAPEMGPELIAFARDTVNLTGLTPYTCVIERAAGGFGLLDELEGQLPLLGITPRGSKEIRAQEVSFLVHRGSVALPVQARWLKEFEQEVGGFPLAERNDIPDALTHALKLFISQGEFQQGIKNGVLCLNERQAEEVQRREALEEMEWRRESSISADLDQADQGIGFGYEPLSPATERARRRNPDWFD